MWHGITFESCFAVGTWLAGTFHVIQESPWEIGMGFTGEFTCLTVSVVSVTMLSVIRITGSMRFSAMVLHAGTMMI